MSPETRKLLNTYMKAIRAEERPQDHPSLTSEDLYRRTLKARVALVKRIEYLEERDQKLTYKEYPDLMGTR